MKGFLQNNKLLWLLDIIVICCCTAGIYFICFKANLPFSITTINSHLIIEKISSEADGFSKGQKINAIDGFRFNNWEEVELYLDGKEVGGKTTISVDINEKLFETTLTRYYSLSDIIIIGFVGAVFIFFAILVRIKAKANSSAELFHLASLGLGMVITMTAANYSISPFGYGYINRILWLAAYSVTPVLFINFALSFVNGYEKRKKPFLGILYSVSAINVFILGYFFFNASLNNSLTSIKNYVLYWKKEKDFNGCCWVSSSDLLAL